MASQSNSGSIPVLDENKLPATLAQIGAGVGGDSAVVEFVQNDCRTLGFEELRRRVGCLAAGLCRDGAEGDSVILFAPASREAIVAALGILRAGRVVVPLDTQMPDEDLKQVVADSDARCIVTTQALAGRIRMLEMDPKLECYAVDEGDEALSLSTLMDEEPADPAEPGEDEPAVVFYTSGTTGPPKGVPLSHRNIRFQLQAVVRSGLIRGDDRLLLPLPLHHVYPFVIGVLAPLSFGLPVILPEALTGAGLARAMREGKATVAIGVPRLYQAFYSGIRDKVGQSPVGRLYFSVSMFLARAGQKIGLSAGGALFRPIRRKAGPALRLLASGGSPLDKDLARDLEAMGWPVAIGYGLTETAPLLTLKHPGEGSYASVGRAIPGVELRVDPSAVQTDEGESSRTPETTHAGQGWGELQARGPNVFAGYRGLPEKSERTFTPDGWFRTGDIARMDENGFVYLGGRVSSQIALQGGENVNPASLEEVYAHVDGIEEIGILEDDGRLAALVVPDDETLREDGYRATAEKIREGLQAQGRQRPSYQRVARVEITSHSLRRTRLGKLRRDALQKDYQAARGAQKDAAQATGPVPMENLSSEERAQLENDRARALWDLLCQRYPTRPVAPDAHLEIDLGIDSLDWVELSLEIEKATGVAVDDRLIGRVDRVRDLLAAMAEAETETGTEGRRTPLEDPESALSPRERRWADPRGPVRSVLFAFLYGLVRLCMRALFRAEGRGLENVPKGQCILAPNHDSYLDPPAVAVVLGYKRARDFFWAGWTGVMFRNVCLRLISGLTQVVPVDPRRGPLSSLAFLALVLERKHALVWFPEGRRTPDGSLEKFQSGIGLLLQQRDVPVVPVYIQGTYAALPRGRFWPRCRKVNVHFGTPRSAQDLRAGETRRDPDAIAAAVRDAVAELRDAAGNEPAP